MKVTKPSTTKQPTKRSQSEVRTQYAPMPEHTHSTMENVIVGLCIAVVVLGICMFNLWKQVEKDGGKMSVMTESVYLRGLTTPEKVDRDDYIRRIKERVDALSNARSSNYIEVPISESSYYYGRADRDEYIREIKANLDRATVRLDALGSHLGLEWREEESTTNPSGWRKRGKR